MKRKTVDGVTYVENFTGTPAELTDETGKTWILPETLAARFRDLCAATGMTGKALAGLTGVTPETICAYRTGKTPCPRSIWKMVETRKIV